MNLSPIPDTPTEPGPGPRHRPELDGDGPAAPPRANGELVFTAPWQSRLFATTMRLCEQGLFPWEIFRQNLIVQIALHEADLPTPTGTPGADGPAAVAYDYWGCWQLALEKLLRDLGIVSGEELSIRGRVVADRPPDH